MKQLTIEERWENGIPHDNRSIVLAKEIAKIDYEQGCEALDFRFGGDGDNGEYLLYILDVYFDNVDLETQRKASSF